jgi:hypothetical protein
MEGEFQIRELIDAGKIPADEGQRLIEELHTTESRDRVLREGLAEIESTKRASLRWALVAVGFVLLALLALVALVLTPAR